MCGFGEKDRRPIDPPPVVQLLMDDLPDYNQIKAPPKSTTHSQPIQHGKGKHKKVANKNGKSQRRQSVVKQYQGDADLRGDSGGGDDDCDDESYKLENDSEGELDKDGRQKEARASRQKPQARRQSKNATKSGMTSSTGTLPRASSKKHARDADCNSKNRDDQDDIKMDDDHEHEHENDDHEDWPHYEGGALAMHQDPLFVLHASLWSEDGTQARSLISTPGGANEPPKTTRIMMGSVVVSPILLNNEMGRSGWYFTFPDLSIRTEGVYTLKFSLMRLDSFECEGNNNNHSNIVAEEMSGPFTVYSAKKFPGMTESTELSKAFAKQGLKIPIRNDLRIRKSVSDRDGMAPGDHIH
ncbi:hypothetical protein BG011_008191 [Mortierella polycephala]|uniref:Velvet domain-containing protein n=1 Tax=Mortierella polycephala TaxID=41804 RepID=A0A9P6PRN0_9FUNG|nr:hypothetical protein BG011_008191 [Mortierella polycephala]